MKVSIVAMTVLVAISNSIADSPELVSIVTLLVLLTLKELAASKDSDLARILSQVLNIGIGPLLIIFVLVITVRIAEIVSPLH